MKKIIAISIVALTLVATVLAGCAGRCTILPARQALIR